MGTHIVTVQLVLSRWWGRYHQPPQLSLYFFLVPILINMEAWSICIADKQASHYAAMDEYVTALAKLSIRSAVPCVIFGRKMETYGDIREQLQWSFTRKSLIIGKEVSLISWCLHAGVTVSICRQAVWKHASFCRFLQWYLHCWYVQAAVMVNNWMYIQLTLKNQTKIKNELENQATFVAQMVGTALLKRLLAMSSNCWDITTRPFNAFWRSCKDWWIAFRSRL